MVAHKINSWIRRNKLVVLIVCLALFLRLYRIADYMTFLGDEGRDALVWLRMLQHGKFVLIGPQTSIGNMYLGPLFYYLMLPFYFFLGTVGPSIGTALMAGLTTFLLWFFGQEWFGRRVGLLAALFYAISPVAIVLSRSAWNPNIMPLFALVTIWGIWQFWQKENFFWLVFEGLLLSVVTQSHYLGLLLFPVLGIFWLIKIGGLIKTKDSRLKRYLVFSLLFAICYLLFTVLPLVWFDLRHNFINYQSFHKFFSERQTTVNLKPYKAIPEIWPLWQMLVTRLVAGKNLVVGFWASILMAIVIIVNFVKLLVSRNFKEKKPFILLVTWLLVGLLGLGLYKQHIYDHYFGFLFPAVFLLFSYLLKKIWEVSAVGKCVAVTIFFLTLFVSLIDCPLKYEPGRQMQKTAEISRRIIELSGGDAFNLGLIAKQNYDAGYRYFLEKWDTKPLAIDAQKISTTVSGQLYVVCEEPICQPVGHPQAEIANFGWTEIEAEWQFPWGTKLFKLVRWVQ